MQVGLHQWFLCPDEGVTISCPHIRALLSYHRFISCHELVLVSRRVATALVPHGQLARISLSIVITIYNHTVIPLDLEQLRSARTCASSLVDA